MVLLRLWAWIAVICLISGIPTWAQELDLIPRSNKVSLNCPLGPIASDRQAGTARRTPRELGSLRR